MSYCVYYFYYSYVLTISFFCNLLHTGYNTQWTIREYGSLPYHKLSSSINLLYNERHTPVVGAQFSSQGLLECERCHVCTRVASTGSVVLVRQFHIGSRCLDKEPAKASSKVEETVNLLKGKAKDEAESKEQQVVPKKPLSTRIMDEIKHYYHGFRLLFVDIYICRKLAMKALKGQTLTRREHRLVSYTSCIILRNIDL